MTPEFLAGKVPEIVYKKAIECIPGIGMKHTCIKPLTCAGTVATSSCCEGKKEAILEVNTDNFLYLFQAHLVVGGA